MITYNFGNILESKADVICQQVNCKGVMGAGLAKQIKNKFPNVYTEYAKYCTENKALGTAQFSNCDNTTIANCFGQDAFGRDRQYTDYDALKHSLTEVKNKFNGTSKTIAIPYGIGCGLAGGEWKTVQSIIDEVFDDYAGEVQIWKLEDRKHFFLKPNVYVKYHDKELKPITFYKNGDWIDLRSDENVHLNKGESKVISLGISIKLPRGYEAYFAPRSSTFKSWNVMQTNSFAVIDNSYCGDNDIWKVQVIALGGDIDIKKNDRLVQFRIQRKQPHFNLITTDMLGGSDRGGYGTSGKN